MQPIAYSIIVHKVPLQTLFVEIKTKSIIKNRHCYQWTTQNDLIGIKKQAHRYIANLKIRQPYNEHTCHCNIKALTILIK